MSRTARLGLLLATVAGIAVACWTIGRVGAAAVAAAMVTLGWVGMLVFMLWSAGVLVLLGLAWHAVSPDVRSPAWPWFVWARTTREAATDVLPFSQLGGIVGGVRTLAARNMPAPAIYASMIADLTTEMAAQLLFTLGGVAVLLVVLAHVEVARGIVPLAVAGVVSMTAMMATFAFAQRPMLTLAGKVGARFVPESVALTTAVREQLDRIYRQPLRVIAAFLFNLAAWIASAAGAWIALWFMGSPPPLWAILTLEALIFTVRSVAFAIPGAVGVQEAVYALLGPILGLPPTTAGRAVAAEADARPDHRHPGADRLAGRRGGIAGRIAARRPAA